MGDEGGWSLISLNAVASSWTVGVSASVIFPCTIKVQKKLSSGTGSPGVSMLTISYVGNGYSGTFYWQLLNNKQTERHFHKECGGG